MSNGKGPLTATLRPQGTPDTHSAGGAEFGHCRRGLEMPVPGRDIGTAAPSPPCALQKGGTPDA